MESRTGLPGSNADSGKRITVRIHDPHYDGTLTVVLDTGFNAGF